MQPNSGTVIKSQVEFGEKLLLDLTEDQVQNENLKTIQGSVVNDSPSRAKVSDIFKGNQTLDIQNKFRTLDHEQENASDLRPNSTILSNAEYGKEFYLKEESEAQDQVISLKQDSLSQI